ncbi:serine hydrolase [Sporolactobacillus sp. THM19-2]|uniref:serine hydrolase n=1 Tax=Sporolactobacillus sp. THM19-2 TaxID=2511171 RepID=UPI00101FA42B|nr:serine hydrolase [Sporolactobacillus sp. THM19-2]RYL92180.1 serine hydrolase [Sporolactobacillus sp. THM19-2]
MNPDEAFTHDLSALVKPFGHHIAVEAVGSTGFHYAHHADVPMLSASLIKLPILLYAVHRSLSDSDFFDRKVRLPDENRVGGSGVLQILSGRDWSVRDLLALMINVSDNTATNLMLDLLGIGPVQTWARQHGFTDLRMERKMMDTAAEKAGKKNMISAHDACRAIELIFPGGQPVSEEIGNWFLHQQFRHKLPALFDELPDPVKVYNKTGEMNEVDHDAALFTYQGHDLYLAVLSEGVKDRQAVLNTIQRIGLRARDYILKTAMQH